MKKILFIFVFVLFIMFNSSNVYCAQCEEIGSEGIVISDKLRLRSGLSKETESIKTLEKGDKIFIYDIVDNWYVVRTEDNFIGAVCGDYVEIKNEEVISTSNNAYDELSGDEKIFLNLINNERIKNNLEEYVVDDKLENIARLKSKDLVEANYFSHKSKKYGTIYDMLDFFNVSYNFASENIARNNSAENAVKELLKSENHKNNILSEDFKYTGLSSYSGLDGSNIYVEIFSY